MAHKANHKSSDDTAQPVARGPQDTAPILPFAPYQDDEEWDTPFSSTLLEKSNKLAREIWPSQENYGARFSGNWRAGTSEVPDFDVRNKNSDVFEPALVELNIIALLSIYRPTRLSALTELTTTLAKLKKLEKTYDVDELFFDGARQRIIDDVLLLDPPLNRSLSSFEGGLLWSFSLTKAVTLGLLTDQEVRSVLVPAIEYLPYLRKVLSSYTEDRTAFTVKELTAPLTPRTGKSVGWNSPPPQPELLTQVKNMRAFLHRALPYAVASDHIPEAVYPTAADRALASLQRNSKQLRDATTGFIQETRTLSELLEAVMTTQQDIENYFVSMARVVGAYFRYLNHIGMSYTQLVEESIAKVEDNDCPF